MKPWFFRHSFDTNMLQDTPNRPAAQKCYRNAHQVSRPEGQTLPYNLKARENKSSLRSAKKNRLAKCEAVLASA
jgi:hypothetical protein